MTELPSVGSAYRRALFLRKPGLGAGETIPPIEAEIEKIRIDRDDLERYRRFCGFVDTGAVPITYPQLLANALHGHMIGVPQFPLKPVGLIHVRNVIVQHRALLPDETLALSARIAGHRDVPQGVEVDFHADIAVAGEVAWRCTSTALIRQGNEERGERRSHEVMPGDEPKRTRSAIWSLPANLGRAYAAVSGDYNPIHLWALTAKLFGFRRPIMHGAWSLARSLAELDRELPSHAVRVEAAFKRPIFLPGTVLFSSGAEPEGIAFALRSADGREPYLIGRAVAAEPLAPGPLAPDL